MIPRFEPPDELAIAAPFWDAIAAGELRLPRCSACQRWQWYPDATGPDCAGASFEWVPVPSAGTVYSMVRVNRAFLPGGRDDVPFVVGLVELDGAAGLRLAAVLRDSDDLVIEGRVRAEFIRVDGRPRVVFAAESR